MFQHFRGPGVHVVSHAVAILYRIARKFRRRKFSRILNLVQTRIFAEMFRVLQLKVSHGPFTIALLDEVIEGLGERETLWKINLCSLPNSNFSFVRSDSHSPSRLRVTCK